MGLTKKKHKPPAKGDRKKKNTSPRKSPVKKISAAELKKEEERKRKKRALLRKEEERKRKKRALLRKEEQRKRKKRALLRKEEQKKAGKKKAKHHKKPKITPDPRQKAPDYVSPELVKIAKSVLSQYKMDVKDMTVVATKPKKGGAIWQVKTKKEVYGLKLLHRRAERSLFSIWAQDYLVKNKARVPALIPNKDGRLYVEKGGKLWIVSQWIKTLHQAGKDLEGAQAICYGLGEFHHLSRGYIPPAEAEYSSRLNRWPDYYERILTKLGWVKALAQAYHDTPAGPVLLSAVELFTAQAREGLNRLRQSPYTVLTARGEHYWGLAHQDYGWGNAQLGPGGLWVIDLDGVAFDLPIRDLRKLISSIMSDREKWDLPLIKAMISAYHKANPIEQELYEVFLIDLAMPNEFYQFIKTVVFDPVTFLNKETKNVLEKMLRGEKSKQSVLRALSGWKVG